MERLIYKKLFLKFKCFVHAAYQNITYCWCLFWISRNFFYWLLQCCCLGLGWLVSATLPPTLGIQVTYRDTKALLSYLKGGTNLRAGNVLEPWQDQTKARRPLNHLSVSLSPFPYPAFLTPLHVSPGNILTRNHSHKNSHYRNCFQGTLSKTHNTARLAKFSMYQVTGRVFHFTVLHSPSTWCQSWQWQE